MSLHILRHKKWHVWNQDNEDTFTKDENEFMAKVEAEEKSSKMADMEKRDVYKRQPFVITLRHQKHNISALRFKCCSNCTIDL